MKQMMLGLALLALAACLPACRRETVTGARARGLARIQELARFRPPANGQLTDTQIDRYMRVRRASKGQPDAQAARAAGVDPDEYSWIRARVIEALVALDTRNVRAAAEETYAKTLAAVRQARQSARDPTTRRVLDEQIAGLERERASLKQMDAPPISVALNAKRLARRRAEIEALSP